MKPKTNLGESTLVPPGKLSTNTGILANSGNFPVFGNNFESKSLNW